jgi:hypothetical protein
LIFKNFQNFLSVPKREKGKRAREEMKKTEEIIFHSAHGI